MKKRKKIILYISVVIIFIIGILLYFILSNPYLNYYNKSDLDTNTYPINLQYEIPQTELDTANNNIESQISDNINSGLINWGILPITNTKDGSSYLNMISIFEINVLKRLIYNIELYNNTVLTKGINSDAAGIDGWHVIDDMSLVSTANDDVIPQDYLSNFIPYIKNPKVKKSAEQLLNITNNITKTTSNFYGWFGGNEIQLQKENAVLKVLNNELFNLEINYKNMEHGSICAKKEWSKLTIKRINMEEKYTSP